jgi:hypothetical protein
MQSNNSAFLKIKPINKTKKNRGRTSPTADTLLALLPVNQGYQEMRQQIKLQEQKTIQERIEKREELNRFMETIKSLTPEQQAAIRQHLDTLHRTNAEIAELKEKLDKKNTDENTSEDMPTSSLKRTKSVLKNMDHLDYDDEDINPDPMGTWRDSTSKGGQRQRKTKHKKSKRKGKKTIKKSKRIHKNKRR